MPSTKYLMQMCPLLSARDAVLVVLYSDMERIENSPNAGEAYGRKVVNLKKYNKSIRHETLYRLLEEGLIVAKEDRYIAVW